MIQQPGGTCLETEQVKGEFREAFLAIFNAIERYHDKLGFPETLSSCVQGPNGLTSENLVAFKVQQHAEFCVALHAEITELLEAVPWKPWRPLNYKEVDLTNVMEELVDIIFFIGSMREIWNISPLEMADILERKLIENYRRISNGYNKIGG